MEGQFCLLDFFFAILLFFSVVMELTLDEIFFSSHFGEIVNVSQVLN